ncbi:MAG: spore photoproduct lyase [Firmicutes bacterium]|nr:spore photoproduct lyase [Bacillota bacterium]
MEYLPERVFLEKKAMNYPLGKKLYDVFTEKGVDTEILKSNRVTKIPGKNPVKAYAEGKRSLVVRVRKNNEFQSCKPSAHYQLPLVSGCAGKCEYCYLNTRFGNKPYTTVYANVDEILEKTDKYIKDRAPEVTYFEAAATSDPIPLERYTGVLAKTIDFIGKEEYARLRFVTKFSDVDSILNIKHNNHTTIRFSINTDYVIDKYEHGTDSLDERVKASKKVFQSGYKLGFIIGPVILYKNWKKDYLKMLNNLKKKLGDEKKEKIYFEVISHRFTKTAKNKILEIFPSTTLPMDEEKRKFKYGQFGYGKYVYNKEELEEMNNFFKDNIKDIFPSAEIDYII